MSTDNTNQSTDTSTTGLGSEPDIVEHIGDQKPTASHALAEESTAHTDVDEVGTSQVPHDEVEVNDLGWNEDASQVPRPMVGGLENEELWTLIRRFDKQIFRVKAIHETPLANLDMNIADEEEFSPEKLRAQLERMYMTVVISLVSFWKHIARLRSWNEWERTSYFLAVYSVAWFLDLLIPTIIGFLIVLILYPPARDACFPPMPPSIVDSKTGKAQKPAAGVVASQDTVTGAPEKHKGEGVEQEAHSFVNSISTVSSGLLMSTSAGKKQPGHDYDDKKAPDPAQLTTNVFDAKDKTDGTNPNAENDRTKKPVANAVWAKARPAMHMISDAVDTWERFGNALSPTPPFPTYRPRLILASCLLPLLVLPMFVTSYMAMKGAGFMAGFSFFGDPIITPAIAFANRTYPHWRRFVELRHTILRGIPTNAQLAITLLRIGERNKAPLPPPPASDQPPALESNLETGKDFERLGASHEETRDAMLPDKHDAAIEEKEHKPKRTQRLLDFLKSTAKGGAQAAITADKAKAAAGWKEARNRLGVVNKRERFELDRGPVSFPARFDGNKGHVFLTTTATTPAVSWTSDLKELNPAWTVAIGDIEEIRKVGGLGWKSKLVVGWSMQREVADGLVLCTKDGRELQLTAIVIRDELFDRLVAIGDQMWEVW